MSATPPRRIALLFLIEGSGNATSPRLLLGLKKTSFGAGKIVGVGGHVERGETPGAAAVREMEEETGVSVAESDLCSAGMIRFRFPRLPDWNMDTWLFTSRRWVGEPHESEELVPQWFSVDALPLAQMWQDAERWVPRVARGETVNLTITMAPDNEGVEQVEDLGTD